MKYQLLNTKNKKKSILNFRIQIIIFTFEIRPKHITRSQKGRWILDIISQNQTFIFLLPFKTIVIMAS